MAIPSREDAARILRSLEPPSWHLQHSAAVADVAAFLAQKVEEQGHAISTSLVEAAALLHDVDKALPKSEALKGLGHADAGAHWLSDSGYGELSGAVAAHPVTRLADNDHYATWARAATVEERVVAYADKRAKSDLVSMDERFENWVRKHGDTDLMRIARERAEILEASVCAAAGIRPEEVQRLRWAEAALADTATQPG
jgi:putative nucleotidyltransferase with HDIG domain